MGMLTKERSPEKHFMSSIKRDTVIEGEWWLPAKPDEKVVGTLYLYQNQGIRLKLSGSFTDHSDDPYLATHESIVGRVIPEGFLITILNASEYKRNLGAYTRQQFEASTVISSFHIIAFNELAFNRYEFSTTYLVDWIDPDLIKYQENPYKLTALPDNVTSIEHENIAIKFVSRCKYKNEADYSEGLRQFSWIAIESTNPLPYQHFKQHYLHPLVRLIEFCTNYKNSIDFCQGFKNGISKYAHIDEVSGYAKVKHSETAVQHNMLFTLHEDGINLTHLVKNWLRLYHQCKHVFDLYFDSFQIDKEIPNAEFLAVTQALESFHGELEIIHGARESESKVIFLKNVASVKALIASDMNLSTWFRDMSTYRPELKVRLNELIDNCENLMKPIIANREEFIGRVLKTRNYYTHYNPKLRNKSAVGDELNLMTHALRMILIFHLLKELGFSVETVNDIMSKSSYYNDLVLNAEDYRFWATKNE